MQIIASAVNMTASLGYIGEQFRHMLRCNKLGQVNDLTRTYASKGL